MASGYRPPPFPGASKSGQFICYKTGQFYLLLTVFLFCACPVNMMF
jgi:hypothetical protein